MRRSTWKRLGPRWPGGERTTADTTLRLPEKPERDWPRHRVIHVYLDNARYHHAKKLKPFPARPDCRTRLHFPPPRKWEGTAETVTDSFRVITHNEYRLVG